MIESMSKREISRRERQEAFFYGMETGEVCKNCKHFYQHYVLNEREKCFEKIAVGHCVYPRMKDRKVFDTCDKFERRPLWRD